MTDVDLSKSAFTSFDAANIFNVNVTSVKNWVSAGLLDVWYTPGGHMRINKDEIIKFLKSKEMPNPFEIEVKTKNFDNEQDPTCSNSNSTFKEENDLEDIIIDALEQGAMSTPELSDLTGISRKLVERCVHQLLASSEIEIFCETPFLRYSLSSEQVVLDALASNDMSAPELSEVTYLSRQQVNQALFELLQQRLVEISRDSTPRRFKVSNRLEDGTLQPSNDSVRTKIQNKNTTDNDTKEDLVAWCFNRIGSSSDGTILVQIAELVNRRGVYRAKKRLRAKAVREVAQDLAEAGFQMLPDYRNTKQSPGVDAVVTLRLGGSERVTTTLKQNVTDDRLTEYVKRNENEPIVDELLDILS